MSRTFHLVDVFTDRRYSGNQLGVVTECDGMSTAQMQAVARELNFSETTFVSPPAQRGKPHKVRIFTPNAEVPFAGHPTLGTAHVIRTHLLPKPTTNITLGLGVGNVSVFHETVDGHSRYWMRQPRPKFGQRVPVAAIAAAVGLKRTDVSDAWPIEEVSTGLPHLVIPVRSRAALERARVDRDPCFALLKTLEAKALLLFAVNSRRGGPKLSVRMFADLLGVPEDPATGSGNGCLAAYLAKHRCLGSSRLDVESEQGWLLNRPSRLYLRATEIDGRIDVRVGGGVVDVARGQLV